MLADGLAGAERGSLFLRAERRRVTLRGLGKNLIVSWLMNHLFGPTRFFAFALLGGLALSEVYASALNIVNYYSPKNAERPSRPRTDCILLHTTEGPKKGSLSKVHRRGECHYFVDEHGKVYRIIHRNKVALHAGRSMWNGRKGVDNFSVGIEVVGYHNKDLTNAQYTALKQLILELQGIYKIPDESVLCHSMVAYGAPNRWHKRSHRGRKRCGMQFARWSVRTKLGLTKQPRYDPDVRAKRLVNADPYLAKVLYGTASSQDQASQRYESDAGDVISSSRSAWDIAREEYQCSGTIYIFPNGKQARGNEITNWKAIPVGTKVIVPRVHAASSHVGGGLKTLGTSGYDSLWDIAGEEYRKDTTVYFLPNGSLVTGDQLTEASAKAIPKGTKVLVGYTYGGAITARRRAYDICGARWDSSSTYYRLPNGAVKPGSSMNENAIPMNTRIYYRN